MPRRAVAGAREQILDVAAALFYARGVRAVGMAEVAEAAGCGKNLLYHRFPSKDDLVTAHLERFRAWRDRTEERVLASGDDPGALLVALAAEVADRVGAPGFRGCALRNYLTEFPEDGADAPAGPARVARGYLHDARARVARLVARLGVADPDAVTARIWLVIEGLHAPGTGRADARAGVALVAEIVQNARG